MYTPIINIKRLTHNLNEFSKISRGDCISTNRYYYAVTKKDILCHPKISQTEIGKLVLNKTEYNVIRFLIDVSVGNRHDFEHIGLYFKTSFGVWLLECQPELLPVWPPVVQQDYMIPVKSNSNLICAVKSGNAVPTVYTYLGNTAYRKDILTTESGVLKCSQLSTKEKNNDIITLKENRKLKGVNIMGRIGEITKQLRHKEWAAMVRECQARVRELTYGVKKTASKSVLTTKD